VPGVHTTAAQTSGRPGSTPARRNNVLPTPDGPITARSRRARMRVHNAAISASRPMNTAASFSVKARKPGYGLRSFTSCRLAAPLGVWSTASRATATSCALG
jgi:hypothetical protein